MLVPGRCSPWPTSTQGMTGSRTMWQGPSLRKVPSAARRQMARSNNPWPGRRRTFGGRGSSRGAAGAPAGSGVSGTAADRPGCNHGLHPGLVGIRPLVGLVGARGEDQRVQPPRREESIKDLHAIREPQAGWRHGPRRTGIAMGRSQSAPTARSCEPSESVAARGVAGVSDACLGGTAGWPDV